MEGTCEVCGKTVKGRWSKKRKRVVHPGRCAELKYLRDRAHRLFIKGCMGRGGVGRREVLLAWEYQEGGCLWCGQGFWHHPRTDVPRALWRALGSGVGAFFCTGCAARLERLERVWKGVEGEGLQKALTRIGGLMVGIDGARDVQRGSGRARAETRRQPWLSSRPEANAVPPDAPGSDGGEATE